MRNICAEKGGYPPLPIFRYFLLACRKAAMAFAIKIHWGALAMELQKAQAEMDAQYWNGCAVATYAVFGAGGLFQLLSDGLDVPSLWLLSGVPLAWIFRHKASKSLARAYEQ